MAACALVDEAGVESRTEDATRRSPAGVNMESLVALVIGVCENMIVCVCLPPKRRIGRASREGDVHGAWDPGVVARPLDIVEHMYRTCGAGAAGITKKQTYSLLRSACIWLHCETSEISPYPCCYFFPEAVTLKLCFLD